MTDRLDALSAEALAATISAEAVASAIGELSAVIATVVVEELTADVALIVTDRRRHDRSNGSGRVGGQKQNRSSTYYSQ